MEMTSLKKYAEEHKISYEAVRKQVNRYAEELSGHIIKQDRTQYLDPWAVEFLTNRRRESPIVMVSMEQSEENERLKEEIELLRAKLMTAQNELLNTQNELLKEKDRVISLQDEARKTIEDRTKYTALLEDSKAKDEKLKEAGDQIETLRKEKEEDQRKIEDLQRERDEAQAEAQSFTRSIFGLYRKK